MALILNNVLPKLDDNEITGTIPTTLGNLGALNNLNFGKLLWKWKEIHIISLCFRFSTSTVLLPIIRSQKGAIK